MNTVWNLVKGLGTLVLVGVLFVLFLRSSCSVVPRIEKDLVANNEQVKKLEKKVDEQGRANTLAFNSINLSLNELKGGVADAKAKATATAAPPASTSPMPTFSTFSMALLPQLQDNDPDVAMVAQQNLLANQKEAIPPLVKALENSKTRGKASETLTLIGCPALEELIRVGFNFEDDAARTVAKAVVVQNGFCAIGMLTGVSENFLATSRAKKTAKQALAEILHLPDYAAQKTAEEAKQAAANAKKVAEDAAKLAADRANAVQTANAKAVAEVNEKIAGLNGEIARLRQERTNELEAQRKVLSEMEMKASNLQGKYTQEVKDLRTLYDAQNLRLQSLSNEVSERRAEIRALEAAKPTLIVYSPASVSIVPIGTPAPAPTAAPALATPSPCMPVPTAATK